MFLCARSASNDPINGIYVLPVWNILLSWCVWLTATRTAKLAPHLWNRPGDIIYVPVWVAFGYYFSVMKLYALFTLHEVSREDFLLVRELKADFPKFRRLVGELELESIRRTISNRLHLQRLAPSIQPLQRLSPALWLLSLRKPQLTKRMSSTRSRLRPLTHLPIRFQPLHQLLLTLLLLMVVTHTTKLMVTQRRS